MEIKINGNKYIVGLGLAFERTPKDSRVHIGLGWGGLTIRLPWFAVKLRPWGDAEDEHGKV